MLICAARICLGLQTLACRGISHARRDLAGKQSYVWQGLAHSCRCLCADTELEAEVEPSLETEQRLAAEEAARVEAARKQDAELARLAREALAQAAEAERQRAQQEADLERLRQVGQPLSRTHAHTQGRGALSSSLLCRAGRPLTCAFGIC